MNDCKTDVRRQCPMRHGNGNCLPAGGFCLSVNDEICAALHSAFAHGNREAWPRAKGKWINDPPYYANSGEFLKAQECSVCHALYISPGATPYANYPYCANCGAYMEAEK